MRGHLHLRADIRKSEEEGSRLKKINKASRGLEEPD